MNNNFKLFNTVLQQACENTLNTLSDYSGSGPSGATGATGSTGPNCATGATGSTCATGTSSFIEYTNQSACATTPDPGSTGKFTISGSNLYVWNGSLWVAFAGNAGV